MSWNYRILASKDGLGYSYFEIHEVYYNKKGIPDRYTVHPVTVGSEEGHEGIKWVLDNMAKALDRPILDMDKFPEEYQKKVNEE